MELTLLTHQKKIFTADANHDSKLNPTEAEIASVKKPDIGRVDTSKDGFIQLGEYLKYQGIPLNPRIHNMEAIAAYLNPPDGCIQNRSGCYPFDKGIEVFADMVANGEGAFLQAIQVFQNIGLNPDTGREIILSHYCWYPNGREIAVKMLVDDIQEVRAFFPDAEITQSLQSRKYFADDDQCTILNEGLVPRGSGNRIRALRKTGLPADQIKRLYKFSLTLKEINHFPAILRILGSISFIKDPFQVILSLLDMSGQIVIERILTYENAEHLKLFLTLPLTDEEKRNLFLTCIRYNIEIEAFLFLVEKFHKHYASRRECIFGIEASAQTYFRYGLSYREVIQIENSLHSMSPDNSDESFLLLDLCQCPNLIDHHDLSALILKLKMYGFTDSEVYNLLYEIRKNDVFLIQSALTALDVIGTLIPQISKTDMAYSIAMLVGRYGLDKVEIESARNIFLNFIRDKEELSLIIQRLGYQGFVHFFLLVFFHQEEIKEKNIHVPEMLQLCEFLKRNGNVNNFERYSFSTLRALTYDTSQCLGDVLLVVADHDHNGSLLSTGILIEQFFKQGYRIFLVETDDEKRIFAKAKQVQEGSNNGLFIKAHGSTKGLALATEIQDDSGVIDLEDQNKWQALRGKFSWVAVDACQSSFQEKGRSFVGELGRWYY